MIVKKITDELIAKIKEDINAEMHPNDVARKHGISVVTLNKYVKTNYRERMLDKKLKKATELRKKGYKLAIIAEIMGVSPATVRFYLYRAIKKGYCPSGLMRKPEPERLKSRSLKNEKEVV